MRVAPWPFLLPDIGKPSTMRNVVFYLCPLAMVALESPAAPNVVFIMSDDHAYQAIGAYGHGLADTPNIDSIAEQGIRFERCYVTNSICGPSRAAILTGKYSRKNGVPDNYTPFDGSQTTLPKLLQRAGYQTAIIGKWHLKSEPTGFDHWDILKGQGKYYRPHFLSPSGNRSVDGYVTHITTALAEDWLERQRDPDRPFFLMVHHKAPHRPWDPATDQLTQYQGANFPEPPTLYDDYQGRSTAVREAQMRLEHMRNSPDLKIWSAKDRHRKWLYNHMTSAERAVWEAVADPRFDKYGFDERTGFERRRWVYQLYLADYLRCVRSVDASVGRLLDCLERNQLTSDTIVIYTSDQGFYLGEHGWFDKRLMYEPSLRTPFLLRWPSTIKQPRVVTDAIVSNVDFAATLLDAAGAAVPADMDGASFLPLLVGETLPQWRDTFYYEYLEGPARDHHVARHDGVTDGRIKLIHYHSPAGWELYDLQADPQETSNILSDPKYRGELQRMRQELTRLRRSYGAPSTDTPAAADHECG